MKDILLKFVSRDETRSSIAAPFTIGEFTYATDGRILIKVPKVEGCPGNEGFPNVKSVWEQFLTDKVEWSPCPYFNYEKKFKGCEDCKGTGYHNCDCEFCNERCPECDGDGQVEEMQYKFIAHRKFNLMFLAKISALPKAELAIHHGGKLSPIAFRFEGGEGLLMPVKS